MTDQTELERLKAAWKAAADAAWAKAEGAKNARALAYMLDKESLLEHARARAAGAELKAWQANADELWAALKAAKAASAAARGEMIDQEKLERLQTAKKKTAARARAARSLAKETALAATWAVMNFAAESRK